MSKNLFTYRPLAFVQRRFGGVLGLWIVLCLFVTSCANRGVGPQGGPKDTIPPMPKECNPALGALNFTGQQIEIEFNEYIQLDNITSNLIMSPPQQNMPEVKARGKKLLVQFKDSLYPNTTYTLDFGTAICDYREKIPLKDYSFYFSTGDEIDTLSTAGYVYDAQTMSPMVGIMVGIHQDLHDSAFTKKSFLRIAKTDSLGHYEIRNIHPGTYRLYAVDDISRDYRMTIGEAVAFLDTVISIQAPVPVTKDTTSVPADILSIASDSMSVLARKDTMPVLAMKDTIPDSLTAKKQPGSALFLFKEQQQKLYFQRAQRDEQHVIRFMFSASPDSMPVIRALSDTLNYHMLASAKRDTISVWLTDSMSIAHDSLFFELKYRKTDSLYQLVWQTDTVRAFWRAPRLNAKAKEAQDRANRHRRLKLKSNARKGFDIFDTLQLICTTPLAEIDTQAIHVLEVKDTIRTDIPFTLMAQDSTPMELRMVASLKPEGNYELLLDSGALHDIYGITHIRANYGLQLKALSEYSTLRVKLVPFEARARIQVLNAKDEVLRELPAVPEGTLFEYLKPDAYYLRLYLDLNGDEQWTTGSWDHKRQPEPVFYFPQKIQTKSNWDFEEEWDYRTIDPTTAKPKELIKTDKKKK